MLHYGYQLLGYIRATSSTIRAIFSCGEIINHVLHDDLFLATYLRSLVRGDICSCVFGGLVEGEYLLEISRGGVRGIDARNTVRGELVLHIGIEIEDVDRVVNERLGVEMSRCVHIYTHHCRHDVPL